MSNVNNRSINYLLKNFARVITGFATLFLTVALTACSSLDTGISKLYEQSITGKTESELISMKGTNWGTPSEVIREANGAKTYIYRYTDDQGNIRENCGQDSMNRIQYVCYYKIFRHEERKVFFGLDGRVVDWKVVRIWRESQRL